MSRRFETMPSRPSLHACSNTVRPLTASICFQLVGLAIANAARATADVARPSAGTPSALVRVSASFLLSPCGADITPDHSSTEACRGGVSPRQGVPQERNIGYSRASSPAQTGKRPSPSEAAVASRSLTCSMDGAAGRRGRPTILIVRARNEHPSFA
jgi:hypothetical protein